MLYDLLLKRPKLTVAVFTLVTILISLQAINVVITSDIEVYMPKDKPSVELLNKIRDEWPIDNFMIYVEAENITNLSALKELDALETALNPQNGTEDNIAATLSIASLIKETYGVIREKFPLLMPSTGTDNLPNSQQVVNLALLFIPDEIKYNLISKDNKNGVIIITTTNDVDADKLLEETVYPLTESTINIKATPTGMLTLYKESVDWVMERIYTVAMASVLALFLVVFIFHRDMRIAIISVSTVLFSVGLTFGTMGLLNVEFAPTVIAVLPLLASLGIAYSLYLINHFTELQGKQKKLWAVKKSISVTGVAVFLSAATTIVGFAALLTSSMPPIENMGVAFVIGVSYCFITAMVVVPCLLIAFPPKKNVELHWEKLGNITRYRKHIILILVALSLTSIACIPFVSSRTSVWEMMPPKMNSYKEMMDYSNKFDAGQSGVILVDASMHQGTLQPILEPELLKKIAQMEMIINTGVENVSAYSFVDMIEKLNGGRLPQYKEEVIELANQLPETYKTMMLNSNYTKTLIYVEMPVMPLSDTRRGVSTINQVIQQYNTETASYGTISELAGLASLTVELNEMLMSQQYITMFISLILVYICLLVVWRSFKFASIGMVPILFMLILQPGAFVLLGIPLNIATMTVSSIAIGMGIDFACHITERARDDVKRMRGLPAIKTTLSRKGPAMTEATIALTGGCLPIFLLDYRMTNQFITLVLFLIAIACIAAIFGLGSIYSWRNGKLLEK